MRIQFIAGLLIGAAAVHFLHTEEGKAFLNRLKKDATKMKDDLEDLADCIVQKGKSFLYDVEADTSQAAS